MEPVHTFIDGASGKMVYRYEVEASTLRGALDKIPGDFTVYWWNQDRGQFIVEVVRTF